MNVGDIVRFLNDVGGGRVARIAGTVAYVEDEDGFETPMPVRECVVVRTAAQAAADKSAASAGAYKARTASDMAREALEAKARAEHREAPRAEAPAAPVPVTLTSSDIAETPEGDTLNVVLGFEATDSRHMSATHYEASLVNDSNYYLYVALLSQADGEEGWTDRYDGIVEPNIQVTIDTYSNADVAEMDRLAVQLVAFKRDKSFGLQRPVSAEFKVDTTKFFKLHCFKQSPYFDRPALTFEVVRDGKTQGEAAAPVPAPAEKPAQVPVIKDLRAKVARDRRPSPEHRGAVSRSSRPGEPIEVDLHIDSLLDSTAGMSSANILNYQIDTFREVMDKNLRNHGQKIVFIHGKGDGVLRQALTKELNYRYKGCNAEDASYANYGGGATVVTIK
ncbi:MAG: DUF2027 domain-containing protein [Muribaculaceae bacterium]